jgi:hypothetical protein
MDDLISRQAALDALARTAREKFNLSDEYNHYLAGLMDGDLAIKELPTIQPEPQEGHWIEGGTYRDVVECYCSECGQLMTTAATVRMNYCPRCGARMKEGEPNG